MVSRWNRASIFPPESKNDGTSVEFDASCNGGGARISERAGTALKITETFEFALPNSYSLARLCDYFCKALRDSSASESPLAMANWYHLIASDEFSGPPKPCSQNLPSM